MRAITLLLVAAAPTVSAQWLTQEQGSSRIRINNTQWLPFLSYMSPIGPRPEGGLLTGTAVLVDPTVAGFIGAGPYPENRAAACDPETFLDPTVDRSEQIAYIFFSAVLTCSLTSGPTASWGPGNDNFFGGYARLGFKAVMINTPAAPAFLACTGTSGNDFPEEITIPVFCAGPDQQPAPQPNFDASLGALLGGLTVELELGDYVSPFFRTVRACYPLFFIFGLVNVAVTVYGFWAILTMKLNKDVLIFLLVLLESGSAALRATYLFGGPNFAFHSWSLTTGTMFNNMDFLSCGGSILVAFVWFRIAVLFRLTMDRRLNYHAWNAAAVATSIALMVVSAIPPFRYGFQTPGMALADWIETTRELTYQMYENRFMINLGVAIAVLSTEFIFLVTFVRASRMSSKMTITKSTRELFFWMLAQVFIWCAWMPMFRYYTQNQTANDMLEDSQDTYIVAYSVVEPILTSLLSVCQVVGFVRASVASGASSPGAQDSSSSASSSASTSATSYTSSTSASSS